MSTVVLVDIDSTIADTRHRASKSPHSDPTATWESYALHCVDDAPMAGTVALLKLLSKAGHKIRYISGRPESALIPTVQWLFIHDLPDADKVRLLKPNDPKDPVEYKREYIRYLQLDHRVVLLLEDWPSICDMAEDEGVPAICVNPKYTSSPMEFFIERGYKPRISA